MIARFIVHIEVHRGYRPRLSIRRAPRPGDRTVDGGMPGVLIACRECDGEGLLHRPDNAFIWGPLVPLSPQPNLEP
jgi:hypothetical protein